jgi:hypothetical protein
MSILSEYQADLEMERVAKQVLRDIKTKLMASAKAAMEANTEVSRAFRDHAAETYRRLRDSRDQ